MENNKNIEGRLNSIIEEKLIERGFFDAPVFSLCRENREEFILHANFRHDLGADSMDIAILFSEFEKEFNIKIEGKDAEKINSVSQIKDYVRRKVEQTTTCEKVNPSIAKV